MQSMKKPTGRPSKFTPELAEAICSLLTQGKSLRAICRDLEEAPSVETVMRWIDQDETFRKQYTRAKLDGLDVMADELLDIADDGLNDTYRDAQGNVRTDQDVIARSKLRVDTRKWYLSKLAPKKYGEYAKLELTGADNGPLQVEHKGSAIAALIAKAAERKADEDKDLEGLV